MGSETVTISKEEYEKLKSQANVDVELLEQLMESFKDIKAGRIRRVKWFIFDFESFKYVKILDSLQFESHKSLGLWAFYILLWWKAVLFL